MKSKMFPHTGFERRGCIRQLRAAFIISSTCHFCSTPYSTFTCLYVCSRETVWGETVWARGYIAHASNRATHTRTEPRQANRTVRVFFHVPCHPYCVLNAAPFENRWWRFSANQGTGFTDEMRMHIACNISPIPKSADWTNLLKD